MKRINERDTMFAHMTYKEDYPEYEDYYTYKKKEEMFQPGTSPF